ncbi:hypothetical protein RO3G_05295 [Rhizopus delemar RA 99-880]|uniref:Uncharacterized protein n=1 Tax=Rhizopus delemar (strain RA 99-880 / ATCC MYA-4621 / FGSC 9543 / NRRL 43880) TaxID=246409 RepID=I1BWL0_RHIO9|nr:hypothetical protein RO3G_05295 [Rhizopus delemar RA 99-880]|eukprot:EIE80590.1 hypothetical protein RO3G_05295 [Rhizopus delemar RA 99-880]
MASLQSSIDLYSTSYINNNNNNNNPATMTREDLLLLAQTEYARQLCKYTKAQLEKNTKANKNN